MHISIIGSGPSSLYLAKHLLDAIQKGKLRVQKLSIFEQAHFIGMGMPYSPSTTDRFNICNISSAELPPLGEDLVSWLRRQTDADLARHRIDREDIDSCKTYGRVAMGEYFSEQYAGIVASLRDLGVNVMLSSSTRIIDIDDADATDVVLTAESGRIYHADRVIIATGHTFLDNDKPKNGYFASPWPIQKLLPRDGELFDFTIGTLGASLSAFDVVTAIAHRHGTFESGASRRFQPLATARHFKIVMHDAHGWLPHLQYEQQEPFREIERHISSEALHRLRDKSGLLSLDVYFDAVCRPVLKKAFSDDHRDDIASRLDDPTFTIDAFCETMMAEHSYADAFAGMRSELPESRRSVRLHIPIHWKEVLDDLMYTLNFHAHWLAAEDHIRFRSVVMSFLMNVIAALPIDSARILLALYEAGCLELIAGRVKVLGQVDGVTTIEVENNGVVETHQYRMFIECGGQEPVTLENFPFPSLVANGSACDALVPFSSEKSINDPSVSGDRLVAGNPSQYKIGGVQIDESFRLVNRAGESNSRIYDLSSPHTTGLRPYSYGLQASEYAARLAVRKLCEDGAGVNPPS